MVASKKKAIEILIGQTFGDLEVLGFAPKKGTSRHIHYRCRCKRCGTEVSIPSYRLKLGMSKSCGCTKIKHGHTSFPGGTKEYKVWTEMKRRCGDPRHRGYERYGGRGIKVCARWLHSFESFFADMGPCPPGYQIDRIDPNGNYEPTNCRWASLHTQNRNRRDNVYIEYGGENLILKDWADRYGISPSFISNRIKKGYSMREIITLLNIKNS